MKVLVDEDTGSVFAELLKERLAPQGTDVFRVVDMGWSGTENGDLVILAVRHGFTHLMSCDKRMAEDHAPVMSVLVVDQMKKTDVDRAAAQRPPWPICCFTKPPTNAEYYGILVDGYEPNPKLARIGKGQHRMQSDRIVQREKWRREKDRGRKR